MQETHTPADAYRKPKPAQTAPSDALAFFGATGDLAHKKIFPALQQMIRRGDLNVPVIGFAKSGRTIDQFRARARDSLEKNGGGVDQNAFAKLIELLQYIDGDYQDAKTFETLRKQLGSSARPIHYLAIPPSLFGGVVAALGKSGCAENGRVVIEKPFGQNLESAQRLNAMLHSVFPEPAIFRIDHYFGKEAGRICSFSALRTPSLSQSGTGTTWTVSRLRWRRISVLRGGAVSMTQPALYGTWFRAICSRWWRFWRWSRLRACILSRCATSE